MKCFKVTTLTYAHTIGQREALVSRIEDIVWATSSRLAVRQSGCPAGIRSYGQGRWTDKPAPGSVPYGVAVSFRVWWVDRYRRNEPGWGRGPGGSFLEGCEAPSVRKGGRA